MYASASLLHQAVAHNGLSKAGRAAEARRRAGQAFWKARMRGMWHRLWARLTGGTHELQDLDQALQGVQVADRSYIGVHCVAMDRIQGSEGREHDFDLDFNPLQSHNMDRWVNVAVARQLGVPLPPVELVQVGQIYFVRDGHHRISVAKALGEREIEAEVIRISLAG